jgi:hypothetical protein
MITEKEMFHRSSLNILNVLPWSRTCRVVGCSLCASSGFLPTEIMYHAPEFLPCLICAGMVFPGQPAFQGFGILALQFALATSEFV